jgi:predicted polyphosphate/ATP-dependent NAD kinase
LDIDLLIRRGLTRMKKCGLIINPIAGMGGSVGLKGTDGTEILERAIELGGVPGSQERCSEALEKLGSLTEKIEWITCPGKMGEEAASKAAFSFRVIERSVSGRTTAQDTRESARTMQKMGVDLILFAGGDGTARDIYDAVGTSQTVLGIPAGVKIHSAVYAQNPSRAGELATRFLQNRIRRYIEAEVMDINEEEYRNEILSARLYGYLKIPYDRSCLQRIKAGSSADEKHDQEAIAHDVVETMSDDFFYIIGAGSTTRSVMELLGLNGSLLGVDIVHRRKLICIDTGETGILMTIRGKKSIIIITPIGGQGYLFGRGNQQISPEVIRGVGRENICVIATRQKIHSLHGQPLLVDTGDLELDMWLNGHIKVITGYHESIIYRVSR